MKRLLVAFTSASWPFLAAAQEAAERQDSPFLTALITWAPFLFLIGLWVFFMRRTNVFGKRGYRDYMRATQERIERIEGHLADIAASLRKIADSAADRRS